MAFPLKKFTIISIWFFQAVMISSSTSSESRVQRPNIIFILADDAGWNDFSFHGSPQIPTPNIDSLALNGIVLNSYYGAPLCTPSRGSMLTGKHPIHLKLQHYVIMGGTADGLPLSNKLLPEYLKELGYSTHLVGKWHLGHAKKEYTPTYRGFDSHFGYWLGKQDYYDHFSEDGDKWGYDFKRDLEHVYDGVFGEYNTDLFTNETVRLIEKHNIENPLFMMINHIAPHSANHYRPLQAPQENIDKFADTIEDVNRRAYAGVMDKLDESVGLIVKALGEKGMLENSIIIFSSDNGGAPEGFDMNFGSNWPLRGVKNTLWEGGTRLAGCIWSQLLPNRVSKELMHVEDWLPTLYEAAGGDLEKIGEIDGLSNWGTLKGGRLSMKKQFLYNIDDAYNNSAIRYENWKLIQGNTSTDDLGGGNWDNWYGPSGRISDIRKLIPAIKESHVSRAMEKAGIRTNEEQILAQRQKEAELLCEQGPVVHCDPYNKPCLFNINDDPCERKNLADDEPQMVEFLLDRLSQLNSTVLPPIKRYNDPRGAPIHNSYTWTNWRDFTDSCGAKKDTICSVFNIEGQ